MMQLTQIVPRLFSPQNDVILTSGINFLRQFVYIKAEAMTYCIQWYLMLGGSYAGSNS
jgi:hypothetical protein